MNSVAAPVAGLTTSTNDKPMLQRVSEIAGGPLAEAASRIDREGYYPLDIMARLAKVGAFGAHLELARGRLWACAGSYQRDRPQLWLHRFSRLVP